MNAPKLVVRNEKNTEKSKDSKFTTFFMMLAMLPMFFAAIAIKFAEPDLTFLYPHSTLALMQTKWHELKPFQSRKQESRYFGKKTNPRIDTDESYERLNSTGLEESLIVEDDESFMLEPIDDYEEMLPTYRSHGRML